MSRAGGRIVVAILVGLLWGAEARAQDSQDPARWIGARIVAIELRIEGKPETSPALLTLIDIQVDDRLAPDAWRRVAQRFDQMPRFEGISVQLEERLGGVALIFDLVPRHPVSELTFEGDIGVAEPELQRQVREQFNGLPALARRTDVEDEVRRILRNEGFLAATVTSHVVPLHDPDRATLVVSVQAGPRTVIGSWEFHGASSLDRAHTEERLGLVKGAPYRERTLAAGLAAIRDELRAKRFYTAIAQHQQPTFSADGTEANLVITIDAGPLVELVVDRKLLPGNVDDLIPIKRQSSVDDDLLEDAQSKIAQGLRKQGYRNAAVSFATAQPSADRKVITYTIKRGLRYRIASLDLPAGALLAALSPQSRKALTIGEWFDQQGVETGLSEIQAQYQARGFHRVGLKPVYDEVAGGSAAEGGIVIHANLTAGPKGVVTAMTFDLGDRPTVTEGDLRSRLLSKEQAPYGLQNLVTDRRALPAYYESRGFLNRIVTITPRINLAGTDVTLAVFAREGPQIFVGEIVVVGNERVKTDVILREITFQAGSPYSEQARIDSQRALRNALGFRNVKITAEERLPGETTTRIVIAVEEADSKTFDIGGGLEGGTRVQVDEDGNTHDHVVFAPRAFVGVGRRNIGGRNRSINAFARVSFTQRNTTVDPVDANGLGFTEYRVAAAYRDLYAFRSLTDALFSVSSEQASRTNFNFERRIGSMDLARSLRPDIRLLGRYSLEWTRRFDEVIPPEDQPLVDRLFPQVRLSIVSGALVWDRRNDALTPTHGWQVSGNLDLSLPALGTEVGFTKMFVQGSIFHPVARLSWLTAAFRAQLGLANGFERALAVLDADGNPVLGPGGQPLTAVVSDLPASQRFYSGGSNSVRGFQLDRLGVDKIMTENGLSNGGNAVVVFNGELRAQVGKLFKRDFGVVGFVDTGNVFYRAADLDLSQLRTTLGFGVRYDSPVGPLRLDFGFKTDQMFFPKATERRWEFHLSIGEVFLMRRWLTTFLVVAWLAGGTGSAQVEIDKTLQHVYGTAIMASDVRQVRLLRLLPEATGSDDAVLTALENRLLILHEVSRQPPPPAPGSIAPPTPGAIAARRQTWTASWPPGTDLPAMMTRAGMTDQALDGWFRDDLRIAPFLDQRFGLQQDAARAQRVAAWLADLRRRANLTGRRP